MEVEVEGHRTYQSQPRVEGLREDGMARIRYEFRQKDLIFAFVDLVACGGQLSGQLGSRPWEWSQSLCLP